MEIDPDALEILKRKAKAHMRTKARAVRSAMSSAAIAQRSLAIATRLAAMPLVEGAKRVALFYPMEGKREVDLRSLDATLRARGVEVAYPAIDRSESADEGAMPGPPRMEFRLPSDTEAMEERGLGFREPSEGDPIASTLDVIVVPALAVDVMGHRIGYGAGFYDRTLPKYPSAKKVIVAFDFQLVAEVPVSAFDIAADWVVTDARILEAGHDDGERRTRAAMP